MIDDAVLERLLGEAADALTIPGDGPARILNERDGARQSARQSARQGASPWADHDAGQSARQSARPWANHDDNDHHDYNYAGQGAGPGARPWANQDGDGDDKAPTPIWTRRRFQLAAAAAAVIAIVSIVAVRAQSGSGPANTASGSASSTVTSPALAPANGANTAGVAAGGSTGSGAGLPSQNGTGAPGAATNPSEVPPNGVATKVIKTAQVSLAIPAHSVTTTMTRLTAIAGAQGGYVASSGTNTAAAGQAANGTATLRIPANNFSTALAQVQSLGTTTSVTTAGQDVTSQYVDLQSRLQALQGARTQYEQILAHAQSIPDILSVEQQLTDLQTQIEQLQGQMNVMADQTAYSTITVTFTESDGQATTPAAAAPPSGIAKAWAHARGTFASGMESVLGATGGLAVFVIVAGVIVVAGRLAWVLGRRRMV